MKYSEYAKAGFNKKMPVSDDCIITLSNGMKIEGVLKEIKLRSSNKPFVLTLDNTGSIYSKSETVSVITIESRTGGNFI